MIKWIYSCMHPSHRYIDELAQRILLRKSVHIPRWCVHDGGHSVLNAYLRSPVIKKKKRSYLFPASTIAYHFNSSDQLSRPFLSLNPIQPSFAAIPRSSEACLLTWPRLCGAHSYQKRERRLKNSFSSYDLLSFSTRYLPSLPSLPPSLGLTPLSYLRYIRRLCEV